MKVLKLSKYNNNVVYVAAQHIIAFETIFVDELTSPFTRIHLSHGGSITVTDEAEYIRDTLSLEMR